MVYLYDGLTKLVIRKGTMPPCEVIFQLTEFPIIGANQEFDSAPLGALLILNDSVLYIRVNQTIPTSPIDWVFLGNVTSVVEEVVGDTTNYDIIMADIDMEVLYNTQLNAVAGCE